MTRFQVVNTCHISYLYHWQRFVPEGHVTLLHNRVVWCNLPADFNDPWDCKPSYNTELLRDEAESERHFKKNVLNNKYYETLDAFREATITFFRQIDQHVTELASLLGGGFEGCHDAPQAPH